MVAFFRLATTIVLTAVAVNAQLPAGLPASCLAGACKAIGDKLTANTSAGTPCAADMTCLCSNDIVKGFSDCYKCAGSASGVDQKTLNDALTAYANGCKTAGHPVDVSSVTSSSSGGSGGAKTGDASSLQLSGFAAAVALGGLALL